GEAEAAVAEYDRGHAVVTGNRAPRVPSDLCVIMSVQVDEAGRDNESIGVDNLLGKPRRSAANLCDLAILDVDIAAIARDAGTVDNGAAFNKDVNLRHVLFPPHWVGTFWVPDREHRAGGHGPVFLIHFRASSYTTFAEFQQTDGIDCPRTVSRKRELFNR